MSRTTSAWRYALTDELSGALEVSPADLNPPQTLAEQASGHIDTPPDIRWDGLLVGNIFARLDFGIFEDSGPFRSNSPLNRYPVF